MGQMKNIILVLRITLTCQKLYSYLIESTSVDEIMYLNMISSLHLVGRPVERYCHNASIPLYRIWCANKPHQNYLLMLILGHFG